MQDFESKASFAEESSFLGSYASSICDDLWE